MLSDLDRQLARWMRYVRRLGGLSRLLAVDEQVLNDSGLPAELKPFALEFDGEQTVLQRILADSMNDLTSLRLTSKLVEQGVLVDPATLKKPDSGSAEAVAAGWPRGATRGSLRSPISVRTTRPKPPAIANKASPKSRRQRRLKKMLRITSVSQLSSRPGHPRNPPARRMKAAKKMRMTPRMRRPKGAAAEEPAADAGDEAGSDEDASGDDEGEEDEASAWFEDDEDDASDVSSSDDEPVAAAPAADPSRALTRRATASWRR